jgi:hypothetical protein
MSQNLRYDTTTKHKEEVRGSLVGTPFSFALYLGDGEDDLSLFVKDSDGNTTGSIEIDGGFLDALVEGLTEIADLRHQIDHRVASAMTGPTSSSLGPE